MIELLHKNVKELSADNSSLMEYIKQKDQEIHSLKIALKTNLRTDGHDLRCSYNTNGNNTESDFCNCSKLAKKALHGKNTSE
jgi:hypothetical protein